MQLNNDVLFMQKLVDEAMGVPKYAYPMNKNAPKPKDKEFAAVLLVEENAIGQPTDKIVEREGVIYHQMYTPTNLKFKVLFTNGKQAPSRFISSFRRQKMLDLFKENRMSILDFKKAVNDDVSLETNWEIRDYVMVDCFIYKMFEDVMDVIEIVEVHEVKDAVVNPTP